MESLLASPRILVDLRFLLQMQTRDTETVVARGGGIWYEVL